MIHPRIAIALISALLVTAAVSQTGAKPAAAKGNSLLERGRYLVVDVGNCGDCHSPRGKDGRPIKGQELEGAQLFFQPMMPVPGWMAVAPGIAGLPGWTDQQGITFLTTGKKPDGSMAAPPMPAIRFNKADATAVVLYLRSLSPTGK